MINGFITTFTYAQLKLVTFWTISCLRKQNWIQTCFFIIIILNGQKKSGHIHDEQKNMEIHSKKNSTENELGPKWVFRSLSSVSMVGIANNCFFIIKITIWKDFRNWYTVCYVISTKAYLLDYYYFIKNS